MKIPSHANSEMIEVSPRAIELCQRFNCTSIQTLRNVNCGLHSGFPECCVMFHTLIYCLGMPSFDFPLMYHKIVREDMCRYIRCPACVLGNKVVDVSEIKRCRCNMEDRILKLIDAGLYDPDKRRNNEPVKEVAKRGKRSRKAT